MSDDQTAPVNRTLLIVLGAVVVLAALFFFVINPLLLDDDPGTDVSVLDEDAGVTPTESEVAERPTEPQPDVDLADPDDLGPAEPPQETFDIFNARDPFQQLVRARAGAGGGTDTGTGTGTDTDTVDPDADDDEDGLDNDQDADDDGDGVIDTDEDPGDAGTGDADDDGVNDNDDDDDDGDGVDDTDDSDDDGDGVDDDVDAVDGGGDDDDANVGGTTVTLIDVFRAEDGSPRATVSVNGTAHTVEEGDTFASRFRLLDISGECATMLFGDNRFTLCEGDRVRK